MKICTLRKPSVTRHKQTCFEAWQVSLICISLFALGQLHSAEGAVDLNKNNASYASSVSSRHIATSNSHAKQGSDGNVMSEKLLSLTTNAIAATRCSPGFYASVGATACTACAAGTFASSTGATTCTACAAGLWSSTGSTTCMSCSSLSPLSPSTSTATATATVDSTQSMCQAEFGLYSVSSSQWISACTSFTPSLGGLYCWALSSGASSADTYRYNPRTFMINSTRTNLILLIDPYVNNALNAQYSFFPNTWNVSTRVPPNTSQPLYVPQLMDSHQANYVMYAVSNTPRVQFGALNEALGGSSSSPNYGRLYTINCSNVGPGYNYNTALGLCTCSDPLVCGLCPPGNFMSNASVCSPCPAGAYSSSYSTTCTACAAGFYSSSLGATACTPCGAGTFASSTGGTTCTACAEGLWSPMGSTACTACDVGLFAPLIAVANTLKPAVTEYVQSGGNLTLFQCFGINLPSVTTQCAFDSFFHAEGCFIEVDAYPRVIGLDSGADVYVALLMKPVVQINRSIQWECGVWAPHGPSTIAAYAPSSCPPVVDYLNW